RAPRGARLDRDGRGAQGGDGPVLPARRRWSVGPTPGLRGHAGLPRLLLRPGGGGGPPVRRDYQQLPERRLRGPVRGARRLRGPRPAWRAGRAWGAASAGGAAAATKRSAHAGGRAGG